MTLIIGIALGCFLAGFSAAGLVLGIKSRAMGWVGIAIGLGVAGAAAVRFI